MSSDVKIYFSALELGKLGAAKVIPGMARSERNAGVIAKRLNWLQRSVDCKGGKSGMRTEYLPPADILALIHPFLQENPDFFGKNKARAAPVTSATGNHKAEQSLASYRVSPGADVFFEKQVGWSEAIIRLTLLVRNHAQLIRAPDDLHQRVALLAYRFAFLYGDGDLQRINHLLDDGDKFSGLIKMAYEADCLKRGIAPGSDLNDGPWYQMDRKLFLIPALFAFFPHLDFFSQNLL
jgi:hypothetical protein